MKDRGKQLSAEDRILWGMVARSTKPLPGRAIDTEAPLPPASDPFVSLAPQLAAPPDPGSAAEETRAHARRGHLDARTHARLAKGRLPIEGRIDLHGLTQSEAHVMLLAFLRRAFREGRRFVLVVTGKGSSLGSDGVLRKAVPGWLATPPFRAMVHSHEDAARRHGGSGALYVRLRRKAEEQPGERQ